MKKNFLLFLILLIPMMIFANSQDEQIMILKKTFYRGNLQDKIQVISEAATMEENLEEIFLSSMDFVVKYGDILKTDDSMIQLAKITVENLDKVDKSEVSQFFIDLFPLYDSEIIRNSILNSISKLQINDSKINILLKDYGFSLLENPQEEPMELLVSTMEQIDDSSFFPVLFKYAASTNVPESVRKQSENVISGFVERYKTDMVSIIEKGSLSEKHLALKIVLNNEKNSDFLRAEIAEKALQVSIIYIGDTNQKNELIDFQLSAIRELRRVSWTRSADLVVSFFNFARSEYENESLAEDDYIEIISCVEELATSKASSILSDYLAYFNSQTEQGISCSESVVLAVINALGNLGNKTAFDNLLYVGYLSYSEEIIEASRVALAGLKF